jgi:hypothetical protein
MARVSPIMSSFFSARRVISAANSCSESPVFMVHTPTLCDYDRVITANEQTDDKHCADDMGKENVIGLSFFWIASIPSSSRCSSPLRIVERRTPCYLVLVRGTLAHEH